MIIYFSATGNNKYLAQKIAEKTGENILSIIECTKKEIIKLLMDKKQLSWTEILNETGYSKATVSKYISLLNNKGIIEFNNKKYVLTDIMLETWLKNKEKMEGQYPD